MRVGLNCLSTQKQDGWDSRTAVEFWSSVECGTFLKGLVRELGGRGVNAAVEGVQVEECESGKVGGDRSGTAEEDRRQATFYRPAYVPGQNLRESSAQAPTRGTSASDLGTFVRSHAATQRSAVSEAGLETARVALWDNELTLHPNCGLSAI